MVMSHHYNNYVDMQLSIVVLFEINPVSHAACGVCDLQNSSYLTINLLLLLLLENATVLGK